MAKFGFTELELKLLRLALNASAQGNEIDTPAVKLIQSLRARGVESVAIEAALSGADGSESAAVISKPDWGLTVLPKWSKHAGELFMDVRPSYLHWLKGWIAETPEKAAKFKDLAHAIEEFFKQGR